jgi:predicted TIM-barrel fold metal-dependent hydrolase
MELGNPLLLNGLLDRFPDLRVWIMHSGDQFYREAISLMKQRPNVYADLSVISNPDILPPAQFKIMLRAMLDAGLEDRLMFGSDNGDISKVRAAIESSTLLSQRQKNKIFYVNAERFFKR